MYFLNEIGLDENYVATLLSAFTYITLSAYLGYFTGHWYFSKNSKPKLFETIVIPFLLPVFSSIMGGIVLGLSNYVSEIIVQSSAIYWPYLLFEIIEAILRGVLAGLIFLLYMWYILYSLTFSASFIMKFRYRNVKDNAGNQSNV